MYLPFMRSVSVVPAGITKFRDGLYPLVCFTKEEAEEIIDVIEAYQKQYFEEFGLHFIHASDEWYILAERELPEEERYDGYIQLENGVGMLRLLMDEFEDAIAGLLQSERYSVLKESLSRTLTIATGKLAYPTILRLAKQLEVAFPGVEIHVIPIRNDFFGETITVSGLITGQDLINQLKEKQNAGENLGDTLQLPSNLLRSGEQVFLDDVTVAQVEEALRIRVVIVEPGGKDFIEAVINPDYRSDRDNENFVYIQAYTD